jgi:hypothetical protein
MPAVLATSMLEKTDVPMARGSDHIGVPRPRNYPGHAQRHAAGAPSLADLMQCDIRVGWTEQHRALGFL